MKRSITTYLLGFGLVLSGLTALIGFSGTANAAVDNTPDCDNVAIIRCGVFSTGAMRDKAGKGDVPKVYNAFGISQNDLKGDFVDGIVWRDGRVTVDGKVVATGAMTAGRNYGGTPISGTNNAGKYPTSKFVTEGQTAFVKMIDGKFSFAVIKSCGNPVSAKPKTQMKLEPEPAFACVNLKSEKITTTRQRFVATASASGGAKIEKYEFAFGDGKTETTTSRAIRHSYEKPGNYTAQVTVHVAVNGKTEKVSAPACKTSVKIVEPPKEMCPYDETLPKDSPDCKKPEEPKDEPCPVPGKEDLPVDSEECVEEKGEETPEVIAETGIGSIASGLVGSSALGYGAYSYLGSRRNLLSSLLKRD